MDIDVCHIQSAKVGPFGNFGAPIGPLGVLDIDVSHIQSAKVGKFGAPIGPLDVLGIDVQCVVKRWSPPDGMQGGGHRQRKNNTFSPFELI